MKKGKITMPKWWYVFLSDLRIRVSRFRFLGPFRYVLPFLAQILVLIQFLFLLFFASSDSSSPLFPDFSSFLENWLFKIETIITSFLILMALSSSISNFTRTTKLTELELVSSTPISTRSYLFGKFLSLQLNNLILLLFFLLIHLELGRIAGIPLNWWYYIIHFIAISLLYLSISWLGITLGPKTVSQMDQEKGATKSKGLSWWSGLLVTLQFLLPLILAFILPPDQFQTIFSFIPTGWFAFVAKEIFTSQTIQVIPSLFGLLAIVFSLIFVVVAHFRTNYTLDLDDFESLSVTEQIDIETPRTVKILERLPLPYMFSIKAFYLLNHRKRSFARIWDIFILLVVVAVIVLGFVFSQWNWSMYLFYAAIAVGFLLLSQASIEGLQILFGSRNAFLLCQSAANGIQKMLVGKMIQVLLGNVKEYLALLLLLLIFHTDKLIAILLVFTIICATFNGLAVGLFALSIAPFFESADITSNPLRGLQLSLPMNFNFLFTSGAIALGLLLFWPTLDWLFLIILSGYFLLTGIGIFKLAELLFKRFEP
ncbi:MAG: hypothetical protein GF308_15300 [Candidatus Heimdallarchaeota archaeon]|nr:hypothetical protein [Candidatus Heimdallarchaeota archaeon]